MDKNSLRSVALIVKASNQQFGDQTVNCELTWSIKRLKEHLAENYPGKPTVDEQKLIYSGQLLKDDLILKDVLRTYEDVQPQTHNFHLVYTPKMKAPPLPPKRSSQNTNMLNTSSDGLRQRNVQRTGTVENSQTNINSNNVIPQMAASAGRHCPINPNGANNILPFVLPQVGNEHIMAQQIAMQTWMQQAYMQYMHQYMNLLSNGVRPEAFLMQNPMPTATHIGGGGGGLPQMPYIPQNFPSFGNQNLGANFGASSAGISQSPVQVNTDAGVVGDNTGAGPAMPRVQDAQPVHQEQPQPQAQPRFPNIVQEDLQENRDWLDIFYSFSRFMVLLTLVYFYSSPLRCMAVIFIGIAIYLYHTGFFRQLAQEEANNNNINNNRNNNNDRIDRQRIVDEPNNPPDVADNNVAPVQQQNPQPVEGDASNDAENNGQSLIALVRTFVVSFFASLLPDTPVL